MFHRPVRSLYISDVFWAAAAEAEATDQTGLITALRQATRQERDKHDAAPNQAYQKVCRAIRKLKTSIDLLKKAQPVLTEDLTVEEFLAATKALTGIKVACQKDQEALMDSLLELNIDRDLGTGNPLSNSSDIFQKAVSSLIKTITNIPNTELFQQPISGVSVLRAG